MEPTYPATGTKRETCKRSEKESDIGHGVNTQITPPNAMLPTAHPGDLENPKIYAAMRAFKHAVIVDNYICGLPVAREPERLRRGHRLCAHGFTGEFSGGSIIHGYPYDANYDDRLQVEEPPHFLNPIEASWFVQRETLATNP